MKGCVLAALALCACSADQMNVYINVSNIPDGTSLLRVQASLNDVPSPSGPKYYSKNISQGQARLGLHVPKDATGSLKAEVDALTDSRCAMARGVGYAPLRPDAEVNVALAPLALQECPWQDFGHPADMYSPPDMHGTPDMKCRPMCSSGVCGVDDGCGKLCTCSGKQCINNQCLTCDPKGAPLDPCDVCPKDDAFDSTNNRGTQTCNGAGEWNPCKPKAVGKITILASDPRWSHNCGAKNGGNWLISSPTSCLVLFGPNHPAGQNMPEGRYAVKVYGHLQSTRADITNPADAGRVDYETTNLGTGVTVTDYDHASFSMFQNILFLNNRMLVMASSNCDLFEIKIKADLTETTLTLYNIEIEPM